jgi:hypothetical protein
MRRTTIALVLTLAPAYLAAQGAPATSGFSAETRVRLEAMLQVAQERKLPTEPMTDRIAEGQAKGAAEAQIIAATQRVEAQLEASQQALIRAGHPQPSGQQVTNGAQLIARGATSAELEAFASRAPSEHRLEVAFAVLTELAAKGVPVDHALSVVSGKLGSGASVAGSSGVGAGKGSLGSGLAGTLTGNLGVGIGRKP